GKASDVEAQKFRGSLRDQFVGIGHDEVSASGLFHSCVARGLLVESPQDVAARDDSCQLACRVENQQGFITRDCGIMASNALCDASNSGACGDYGRVLVL